MSSDSFSLLSPVAHRLAFYIAFPLEFGNVTCLLALVLGEREEKGEKRRKAEQKGKQSKKAKHDRKTENSYLH